MKIPNLIEAKKDVFGTYSAMALMNVQMVFDYIQKKAGIDDSTEETENYWKHPVMIYLLEVKHNGDTNPETTQFIFDKLYKCFPFLKIMGQNQLKYNNTKTSQPKQTVTCDELWYVLDRVLKVLKAYRDTTAHYIIKDDKWNDGSFFLTTNEHPLAEMINSYYTVALRNTRKKYGYGKKDLAFIQNYRMKCGHGTNGGKPEMVVNTDFFLSMQSKNGDSAGAFHLSGVGVAQLICLFLEKKYINVFLSKLNIGGNKRPPLSDEERKVIHRSMAINSIRLPRERIHSDKSIESVSMDILNELKRCPKELFDTLDYTGQSRFRTVSSDFNEVTMLRSTDRFAQLTLEYIDYNKLFEKIRFHVNMGKLRYLLNAEKHCIDGCTRVRVIEHPLNGYGRLGDMEYERKKNGDGTFADTGISIRGLDEVKRNDATAENYPYVVDTRTRYLLENNKVELRFCDEECVMPVVESTKNGRWYVDKAVPSCRMSTLELPAMMFHMYLFGAEETESHIRSVYDTYMRLFAALADGTLTKDNIGSFGIDEADMPQKVLDAVNGVVGEQKDIRAYTQKVLNEMFEDTKRRIDRLKEDKKAVGSRDNKMGKRGFRQIVPGRLADFLAKDIVHMQPSLPTGDDYYGMDRMTGLNYRVMQASIATYNGGDDSAVFDRFKKMFVNADLVGGDRRKNHPFLYYALKRQPTNTVEFYENYLYARKIYLEKIIAAGKTCVPFINPDQHKWCERNADFYKITGEIYLNDISIELPRQMFDEPIKNHLKTIPEMAGVDFDKANVTYLIGEYMKRVKDDGPQEFYSWKRHYRYMDMLTGKTDNKGSLCEQYTTVEEREKLWQERGERAEKYKDIKRRAKQRDRNKQRIPNEEFENGLTKSLANNRNDYQKTEKVIRRYKVQDALLFLMAKKGLAGMVDFEGKRFKLKDIMPDSDKGILSETMAIDFKFENNKKTYTIHSDAMKIKNYGDFYALIHDKRLESLLKLVDSATIKKESLETEFENYDDSRCEVVKLVLDFEKLAYEKYPDMKNYPVEKDRFDFGALLTELVAHGEFTTNDTWVLSQIRNAFSHNIYPKTGVATIKVLPEIARHLINVFESRAKIE